MIVTCEACFTKFNVKDELIKPSGSKVRCSKCQKLFMAYPPIPEDIDPPEITELSDPPAEFSLSPTLFTTPQLDQTGDASDLPVDFKDLVEFDFTELDKLLAEDDKDESGFSDVSQDTPEIKDWQDTPGADFETPSLMEAEASDSLSDKADETLEQDLSEITLDESFDGADAQPPGENLESGAELASFAHEPQDFSLDDFEKSLEMDFTDISLISAAEPEPAADQKAGASETVIKPDQKPEDAAVSDDTHLSFDDIETLEITDIEGLLEKQEIGADALNEGAESFQHADAAAHPSSLSLMETEEPLEMDDHYLTFDELQLDEGDSKSATLQEVKESFKPLSPGVPAPPSAPSPTPEPVRQEPASEDKEKEVLPAPDFDKDLEDTAPAPKKGMNPAILIAIIIAVIAAAGYGGFMLLKSMGISIPFISQSAPSKAADPGNLGIKSFDISSKFVDNEKVGKLFVITGKVKNEYKMARGSIQISGKIYTTDKTLAKMETVFCGNILSDTELSGADLATLQERLQNPSGDNHINQKVLPGAAIPFMIVFSNLPVNLEEFTTEVTSSMAL